MLGNHLMFIDSFQFMSSSLDRLVSNLPKDDLIYTSKVFKGKRLNLMSQKGIYPYDFMDSFEKFNQTELPTKDLFNSILNDQHITDDQYDHAKKVWKTFNPIRPGLFSRSPGPGGSVARMAKIKVNINLLK